MVHRTNLAAGVLSNNPVVAKIHSAISSAHSYHSISAKRQSAFSHCAKQVGGHQGQPDARVRRHMVRGSVRLVEEQPAVALQAFKEWLGACWSEPMHAGARNSSERIRAMYVDMATAYTGPDFSDLDSYLATGYGNCPLKYDDSGFLIQPVRDIELEISAIPPPTGQAGRPFHRLKQMDRELEHRVVIVADSISEYGQLAQLAATIVPGSVEVECTFSVMSYIKNKQHNRLLQPHLISACIRLKLQEWYGVSNFLYTAALQHWQAAVHHRQNDA
ncbi:hypothetical protein PLESTM_000972400 [Pleodorina starrii]|nr:hypothetical protein PLESTM_000972400 [Pleodorina starrii]